jgi:hypothetical protein
VLLYTWLATWWITPSIWGKVLNRLELVFYLNNLPPLVKPTTGTDPVGLLWLTALLAVLHVRECKYAV